MLLKGHHNLLTCLNEVPATVDINYVHPVAVLSRRKRSRLHSARREQISMLPPDVGAVMTFATFGGGFGFNPLVLPHSFSFLLNASAE